MLSNRFSRTATLLLVSIPSAIGAFAQSPPGELSPDDLAFFESKIRPLLIENCYECHSAGAERVRGGFLLDSRPAMQRGGESGPSFIAGAPEESRLINMVRHHPDFESMPPKSKLTDSQIADLVTWIERGAPDPRAEERVAEKPHDYFDLEERKQWWSLQPLTDPTPPSVADDTWPRNDYDRFILAKLEERTWTPAVDADRRSLLRRLSFDLTGLPPTPQEVAAFVSDKSPGAYARQVDRLLASPHFGEKWARHWMDLTRYAETKAFEMDYTMPHTYRYRDYLIRAFNADVPYDQFVLEALAGDLLPEPRIDPATGDNESLKGPGFLFLSDGQHGPPDIHEDEARIFARTIDVTTKAFLGSTVACARCHDHKFDAITTADYYSLYGILRSSRITHGNAVDPQRQRAPAEEIATARDRLTPLVYASIGPQIETLPDYLALRDEIIATTDIETRISDLRATFPPRLRAAQEKEYHQKLDTLLVEHAREHTPARLDPLRVKHWLELTLDPEQRANWPELSGLQPPTTAEAKAKPPASQSPVFATVINSLDSWHTQGLAFEPAPPEVKMVVSQTGPRPILGLTRAPIIAGLRGSRVSGVLRSPDFVLDGEPIHFQAKGRFATVRLVVRNYELAGRGPTTAVLSKGLGGDHWQNFTIPTYLWAGEPAYLEIVQHGQYTEARHPREDPVEFDENGYVAMRFDDPPDWTSWWHETSGTNGYEHAIARIERTWRNAQRGRLDEAELDFLSALFAAGLLQPDAATSPEFAAVLDDFRAAQKAIPRPRYVRTLTEGDPQDVPVYIRGSHKNLSAAPNPRRFLDGLGGTALDTTGSGRLEWARLVADPDNPLTARVIANRLWQQVFGQGLVTTVNDFGIMGTAPSHPELLDYLARDLIRQKWSLKSLIRKMVLTRTYQMSTTPDAASLAQDPGNRLLQHRSIRRLDAEAVRDNLLAASGSLDRTLFGESVPAFVESHPDSRAKPKVRGPLDGAARRSVYLELRRNFLPPLLTAFDMPNGTEPIGVRHSTNVPAQSLALLNDPFVHLQAAHWARTLSTAPQSLEDRINHMHLVAFARPATTDELAWATQVLEAMAAEHATPVDAIEPWTDLCHLMFNRKEFIYLL